MCLWGDVWPRAGVWGRWAAAGSRWEVPAGFPLLRSARPCSGLLLDLCAGRTFPAPSAAPGAQGQPPNPFTDVLGCPSPRMRGCRGSGAPWQVPAVPAQVLTPWPPLRAPPPSVLAPPFPWAPFSLHSREVGVSTAQSRTKLPGRMPPPRFIVRVPTPLFGDPHGAPGPGLLSAK